MGAGRAIRKRTFALGKLRTLDEHKREVLWSKNFMSMHSITLIDTINEFLNVWSKGGSPLVHDTCKNLSIKEIHDINLLLTTFF